MGKSAHSSSSAFVGNFWVTLRSPVNSSLELGGFEER